MLTSCWVPISFWGTLSSVLLPLYFCFCCFCLVSFFSYFLLSIQSCINMCSFFLWCVTWLYKVYQLIYYHPLAQCFSWTFIRFIQRLITVRTCLYICTHVSFPTSLFGSNSSWIIFFPLSLCPLTHPLSIHANVLRLNNRHISKQNKKIKKI